MSDKLKKFIQQSKSQFDLESPQPDLFKKIMDRVDTNQKIDVTAIKRFQPGIRWMAIAATITVLIICTIFYFFPDNSIERNPIQLAEKSTIQTKNNIAIADPVLLESTFIKESIPSFNKATVNHFNKNSGVPSTIRKQSTQSQTNTKATEIAANTPTVKVEFLNQNKLTDTIIQESIALLIPRDSQSNQQLAIIQNNLSNVTDPLKPLTINIHPLKEEITSTNIQVKKEKNIPSINTLKTKQETIANETLDSSSSLKSIITKGIFSFLSKKAKKWSGNTLTIENIDTTAHPVLAIHFKGERIEFSKEFSLGIFGN